MTHPGLFRGERRPHEPRGVTLDGLPLRIDPSLRLRRHSPTGFEWGYGGRGPSQLALAILLEVTGPNTALRYYQQFKREIIAHLSNDRWAMPSSDVTAWLATASVTEGGGPPGPNTALRYYQQFKREIIAHLSNDRWAMPSSDVTAWLATASVTEGGGPPGPNTALRYYRQFKREIIAHLSNDRRAMPSGDVTARLATASVTEGGGPPGPEQPAARPALRNRRGTSMTAYEARATITIEPAPQRYLLTGLSSGLLAATDLVATVRVRADTFSDVEGLVHEEIEELLHAHHPNASWEIDEVVELHDEAFVLGALGRWAHEQSSALLRTGQIGADQQQRLKELLPRALNELAYPADTDCENFAEQRWRRVYDGADNGPGAPGPACSTLLTRAIFGHASPLLVLPGFLQPLAAGWEQAPLAILKGMQSALAGGSPPAPDEWPPATAERSELLQQITEQEQILAQLDQEVSAALDAITEGLGTTPTGDTEAMQRQARSTAERTQKPLILMERELPGRLDPIMLPATRRLPLLGLAGVWMNLATDPALPLLGLRNLFSTAASHTDCTLSVLRALQSALAGGPQEHI